MTSISREQLIAFAAGELEGPQADEVAAHLVANPDAARTVALYRTAAGATVADDSAAAPRDLVTRAKGIFRAEQPERPGLMDRIQDVIAHLVYDSHLQPAATRLATRLRAEGRSVDLVLGHPKLKRALADADREGARRIWLLGPDEVARGAAKVRDLETGEERDEAIDA